MPRAIDITRSHFSGRRLLEGFSFDDDSRRLLEAVGDAGDEGDENDALWDGFNAAIMKLLDKYKSGEMTPEDVTKVIKNYLKTHAKLTGSNEPDDTDDDDSDVDDDAGDGLNLDNGGFKTPGGQGVTESTRERSGGGRRLSEFSRRITGRSEPGKPGAFAASIRE